jgi:two-component system sensor histidine kinase and response regulator WspE
LLVEIAGEPYAFPLSRIDRIFMLDRNDLRELEGKQHTMLDDQPVGLVEATRVFDLPTNHAPRAGERLPVVVASDRSHRFGVVVDRDADATKLITTPVRVGQRGG